MYGWSSSRDLRDVGIWGQFEKDLLLLFRRRHLIVDTLAAIFVAVPIVVTVAVLAVGILYVARFI
jgi:hypothetical protein